MPVAVKKISIIGKRWFHVFKNGGGKLVEVECSVQEYADLAKKDAGQPKKQGMTWVSSYETLKFDTQDGSIHDGEFASLDANWCVVKTSGKDLIKVESSKIKNGVYLDE